jgi:hypothetical protein
MSNISIYSCRDGRTRVYLKDEKRVISYPRYLMEQKIGRKLLDDEQVHHKDGNPLNNAIENLEIKLYREHQREHATKYCDVIVKCHWCGNEFLWTAKQQRTFYGNIKRKNRKSITNEPFCSKQCIGSFGRYSQLTK